MGSFSASIFSIGDCIDDSRSVLFFGHNIFRRLSDKRNDLDCQFTIYGTACSEANNKLLWILRPDKMGATT